MNGEGHQMIPLLCHTYELAPLSSPTLSSLLSETTTKRKNKYEQTDHSIRHGIDGEIQKAVTAHMRYTCSVSLDDAAFADEDCTMTLGEMVSSGCQDHADWDVRYDSALKAMKAQVKEDFFEEAANLWEDYLTMKELGYTLSDVAKKHHVNVERAKVLITKINSRLGEQIF